ncbi:MAG: glycosyltransferase family 4 protein [Bacteroidetes bacterium]|nr:glycosyltransferase family 4 protein [Bacteroidota bacterium]
MEIIHVVLGKANPNRMNGVNKVVHQLATRQVMAGHQAAVWGITHDPTHNYPERNFETKLFKAYPGMFRLDEQFVQSVKDKKGKAVFHLHGGFNPVFYAVSRQLIATGIPYVFTPHGAYNVIAMRKSRLRKKIYLSLFEKKIIQGAAYMHCLGKSELEGLKRLNIPGKVKLLPYGFDNKVTQGGIPDYHRFIIGFCGRIDIYTKGLDLLLQAFAIVKRKTPHAALWIIGDGEEKAALEKMVEDKQLKDVWMAGGRFGEEKDALLKQMHVFAHPSRNEGLPSAVLEAASLGIPAVISEATNLGEVVRHYQAGVVLQHPGAEELAEGILELYDRIRSEGWKHISTAARTMVAEAFDWEMLVTEFHKMYKEAC